MAIVLGLDSSTQSISAVVLDTARGTTLLDETVNFGSDLPQYEAPNGFIPNGPDGQVHADPLMWLDALDLLLQRIRERGFDLSTVAAVSGAGQQHGSVYLDTSLSDRLSNLQKSESLAAQLKPALTRNTSPIWMDGTTTTECREIEDKLGGPMEVCRRSGSVAIERFTGPQIRRFSKQSPQNYERTARIHLVSSFLASVLTGQDVAIDFGDGAGMNLMNLASEAWDSDLVRATAPALADKLPSLASSAAVAGNVAPYFAEKYGFSTDCQSVLWTGDNPSSLVGMGAARPGKVVISLGTSDTLFAALPEPLTDPNGFGHVFGNPWGGYMSLVCFRNGSLAREALRDQLGVDWDTFVQAADDSANTSEVMLPYLEPEITPRTGEVGLVRSGDTALSAPQHVRLLLEGQFLNMRLHSQWMNLMTDVIYVTGGASCNDGICQIVSNVFQTPVERLATTGSVGVGAALRAAQAACGDDKQRLEEQFCSPEPGSKIAPDLATRNLYNDKLTAFEELLKSGS